MAVTTYMFGNALLKAFNAECNFLSDSIKVMLATSTYTPNKDTHAYKSDVTNEVTGTNYVATGQALASKTLTYTSAASAPAWQATTAFVVGDAVRKVASNGRVYRCIVAGTTSGSEPSWPAVLGATVTDGSVTWADAGFGYVQFGAANPVWAASTITARYAIFYDATPSTDATRPLLFYTDFGSDVVTVNGAFTIQISGDGIYRVAVN